MMRPTYADITFFNEKDRYKPVLDMACNDLFELEPCSRISRGAALSPQAIMNVLPKDGSIIQN